VIGLMLLAAGGSKRLGSAKQMLPHRDGGTLIRHAALAAVNSKCRPLVAVLGAAAEAVEPELQDLPLQIVINRDWKTGMASSLRAGLSALLKEAGLEAVVVTLCDQPEVTSSLLDQIVLAYKTSCSEIVACDYGNVIGVPALFARSLFPALTLLQGDEGARRVIRSYAEHLHVISFADGLCDIDTLEDKNQYQSESNLEKEKDSSTENFE
jgi:molybdenum cofactor cytidylyltransferase